MSELHKSEHSSGRKRTGAVIETTTSPRNQDQTKETSKPTAFGVFGSSEYPGLFLDRMTDKLDDTLSFTRDIYLEDFLPNQHTNWVGKEKDKNPFVISALSSPAAKEVTVLITRGKDSKILTIPLKAGASLPTPLTTSSDEPEKTSLVLRSLISENILQEGVQLFQMKSPLFPKELSTIEQKHPQSRKAMKIGIIYCRRKQTQAQQMLSNSSASCPQSFWDFVDKLGQKIDLEGWDKYRGDMRPPGTAWYTQWQHLEIIYHVAPILNAEEQRRLIGNDICLLFYFDEPYDRTKPSYFDCSGVDTFGEVPCVFGVIRPNKDGSLFQVGFFSKKNIIPHEPASPFQPLNFEKTKETLLTKFHNGLAMTIYCPPMSRLWNVPRKATLTELVDKWLPAGSESPGTEKERKKKTLDPNSLGASQSSFRNKKTKGGPTLPTQQAFGSYIVVQQFFHGYNRHDVASMMAFVDEDIQIFFDEAGHPQDNVSGLNGAKNLFSEWISDPSTMASLSKHPGFATVLITLTNSESTNTKALRFEVVDMKIKSISQIPCDQELVNSINQTKTTPRHPSPREPLDKEKV